MSQSCTVPVLTSKFGSLVCSQTRCFRVFPYGAGNGFYCRFARLFLFVQGPTRYRHRCGLRSADRQGGES